MMMSFTPKKLLVLNYEYPPIGGGGGVASMGIAEALTKKFGYQITVLTSGVGTSIEETTSQTGVRIIRIPCAGKRKHRSSASFIFMLMYIIKSVLYVFKHRKQLKFDVIHTHFAIPTGPAGYLISKILKLPNVLTLHGGEIFSQPLETTGYSNPIINWVVRFITHRADLVTANSQDTKNGALKFSGIKRDIRVVTLGFIVPSNFTPRPEHIPNSRAQLVMVSRLVPRKGLNYLFEALSHIPKEKWHLTMVGDGPEETYLKELSQKLNIADAVTFRGFVSEKEKFEILNASDLFVLPSLHEGLGLVYFEGMYCRLPIVTTNNGGQTDFLTEKENALLVPIHDPKKLRDKIEYAIDHPDWRKTCGENNYQKVMSLDLNIIVDEYAKLFEDIV